MGVMSQDWVRLARAIRRARESRRMTQQQLAAAARVSESTVQNLEDEAYEYRRRPSTLPQIEAVFWEPGSIDAVLAGGDPTPKTDAPAASPDRGTGGRLPLRVQHELEGEVLDTEVIDLSRGGMKMVVVITRDPAKPHVDDDQLREDFAEWSRVQRELRGIVGNQDSTG